MTEELDKPTYRIMDLEQYEMQALEQEHLRVILLDTRNHAIQIEETFQGSVNSSVVRVAEVFTPVVRRNATSVIVVHNHPSCAPSPSPEDITITRRMVEAGKLMEIAVLDHIIIGHGHYISRKEKGLGFDV